MDEREKYAAYICGKAFNIPACYRAVAASPDDPEGAAPFVAETTLARAYFVGYPITRENRIPMEQKALLDGIRPFLGDNQGIVECEAEENWAYSIVKTLNGNGGVIYTLTFQKVFADRIMLVQGFFEENGITGLRESMVYENLRHNGRVGNDTDPLAGWCRDPYDESIKSGALMNLSELRKFDADFEDSPLMLCRELADCLKTEKGDGIW